MTAALGCLSNALLLGSCGQSKVAAYYIGPYIDKNKIRLGESIDYIFDAMQHAKKYPGIAKDTCTNTRCVQYVLTRILNKLGSLIEIVDMQVANALLGLEVSLST